MSLAPYRRLLRLPGVLPLVLVALVARVPHAMTGVVVTLHVVGTLGKGYGQAGLVAGSLTVGMAFGAPWRGRRVDRLGLRRALVPSVVIEAGVWIVAPFLRYEALLVAAFVAGLFLVPVFSVVRQSLAVLVPPVQQRTAYALDSVGTEMTFMLAPTIGVLIATQLSSVVALVVIGVATVGAGLLLMWFDPPTQTGQLETRTARRGGRVEDAADAPEPLLPASEVAVEPAVVAPGARLLSPALVVVLAAASAAALVLNGTDVGIIASLQGWDRTSSVGWMVALWCVGSVAGGLVYGAGRRTIHPLVLVLALSVCTLPAAFVTEPWQLAIAVVVAGLPCAPALSAVNASLVSMVPERRRGEVMGWSGTANTVGAALGAPVCGWVIDHHGASAGFAAAAVVGITLSAGGLLVLRLGRARAAASADRAGELLAGAVAGGVREG